MIKYINGTTKRFALINTTNYNEDGQYCINTCDITELHELGFDNDDIEEANKMNVDDSVILDKGCHLIRIA